MSNLPKVNTIDRQRASRIAHLFGGNGLTLQQSTDLAAVVFAESREDPEGLTAPLSGWLEDGRAHGILGKRLPKDVVLA